MSAEGFWYDQPENEWVLLVQGAARLQLENREPIDLRPGDYVLIPAHQKHRVDWTDPNQETIWLAVHFA
jgi:cupin 2 domain-containing protein